jgi:hypothetical protein
MNPITSVGVNLSSFHEPEETPAPEPESEPEPLPEYQGNAAQALAAAGIYGPFFSSSSPGSPFPLPGSVVNDQMVIPKSCDASANCSNTTLQPKGDAGTSSSSSSTTVSGCQDGFASAGAAVGQAVGEYLESPVAGELAQTFFETAASDLGAVVCQQSTGPQDAGSPDATVPDTSAENSETIISSTTETEESAPAEASTGTCEGGTSTPAGDTTIDTSTSPMPNPDDLNSGGPRGDAGMPNPDDLNSGGPRGFTAGEMAAASSIMLQA